MAHLGSFWPLLCQNWEHPPTPRIHPKSPTWPLYILFQLCSMPFQPFRTTRVFKIGFWPILGHLDPFWALLGQNWGHPYSPRPVARSNFVPRLSNRFGPPEHSMSDFGQFWAFGALWAKMPLIRVLKVRFFPFLGYLGPLWALLAKIGGTPTLPTGTKFSTWTSCNSFQLCSTSFQTTTRVLKVRFWPFLENLG